MTKLGPSEPKHVGSELIGLGWSQGALVESSVVLAAQIGSLKIATLDPFDLGESLVIASQTCDIVADPSVEPSIEALVCRVDPSKAPASIINSSRFFSIDPKRHLVAYAAQRVIIPKQMLLAVTPTAYLDDRLRLQLFSRWLSARWRRPAFPNEIVERIAKPLAAKIRNDRRRSREDAGINWRQILQFRVAWEGEGSSTPMLAHLVALIDPSMNAEQMTLLRRFVEPILDDLNSHPDSMLRADRLSIVTPEEWSVADAWSHDPMDFDYLSIGGEDYAPLSFGVD